VTVHNEEERLWSEAIMAYFRIICLKIRLVEIRKTQPVESVSL